MNPSGFRYGASMMGNMARMGKYGSMASNMMSGATAPLSTPKAASAISGIASKASKISFSSILGGAQKGITTINQVIPLYNQVRPMFGNVKTVMNVFKGLGKGSNNTAEPAPTTTEEVSVETTVKPQENEASHVIFNQNKPNKPFFMP